MMTYELVNRITDNKMSDFHRLAQDGRLQSTLIIDNDYYIERWLKRPYLYYIHFKNNTLVKVCVYKEKQPY